MLSLQCRLVLAVISLVGVTAHLEWHGARDRFWKHHVEQRTLIYKGVDYYETIDTCLNEILTEDDRKAMLTEEPQRKVGTSASDTFRAPWVFFIMISDAIAPSHVKAVQTLAHCVRTAIPELYESRKMYLEFELPEDIGLGGNCPTHLAPLVGVFLPEVTKAMHKTLEVAYEAAGWSTFTEAAGYDPDSPTALPELKDVGFRASEHLTYKDFKKDGLADHNDGLDTFFTMNYAFSGPEDYDGGYFYIKHGGSPPPKVSYFKPQKYDAMVFLGGFYDHGVTEITSGHREMFSSELWDYPDTPFGSNLWSNYAHRFEQYVQLCDQQAEEPGHSGPCTVDMDKIVVPEEQRASMTSNYVNVPQNRKRDKEEEVEEEQEEIDDVTDSEPSSSLVPTRFRDENGREYVVADFRSKESEPHFLIPKQIQAGEMIAVWWRNLLRVNGLEGPHLIGLPEELSHSFQKYLTEIGMMETARQILYNDKRILPEKSRLYTLKNGLQWRASMQGLWQSDFVRLDPVDAECANTLTPVLASGNFNMVLKQIASKLNLTGIGVRGIDVTIVSRSTNSADLREDDDFNGSSWKIIIPIHIPAERSFSLDLGDNTEDDTIWGHYETKENVGVFVNRNSPYGLGDCDYRENEEFMLAVAIHLDLHDKVTVSYI